MGVGGVQGVRVLRDVELRDRTSFGVAARCAVWVDVDGVESAREAVRYARDGGLSLYVLGEGANVLFGSDYEGVIVHPTLDGMSVREAGGGVEVCVGAGMHFDDLVSWSVGRGLWGLECLAGIPGSVGASPVQNIGAYGAEVSRALRWVRVLDMDTLEERVYGVDELGLGYRDSIFKRDRRGRDLILEVCFGLGYARSMEVDLGRLGMGSVDGVTAQGVSEWVRGVRDSKLPMVGVVGSCGSFFKNPVVPLGVRDALLQRYADMPWYAAGVGEVKLSAGWLIERCGWKGYRSGDAGVWPHQALVLVNYGGATGGDVLALCRAIRDDVQNRMGVRLEAEVNVVGG